MLDNAEFMDALKDGLRQGINKQLTGGYNSPLEKLVNDAIAQNMPAMRQLVQDAIKSCMDDAEFTENLKASVRNQLAKTLVQKFGGELEKQVNALKSDPTTRARIILALEEIVAKAA